MCQNVFFCMTSWKNITRLVIIIQGKTCWVILTSTGFLFLEPSWGSDGQLDFPGSEQESGELQGPTPLVDLFFAMLPDANVKFSTICQNRFSRASQEFSAEFQEMFRLLDTIGGRREERKVMVILGHPYCQNPWCSANSEEKSWSFDPTVANGCFHSCIDWVENCVLFCENGARVLKQANFSEDHVWSLWWRKICF